MTRYTEPTAQQLEEARALIFLAATKRELRHTEHIWDLTLEIEVKYTVHNQRQYLIHPTRGTQSITGEEGYYVHPGGSGGGRGLFGNRIDKIQRAGQSGCTIFTPVLA